MPENVTAACVRCQFSVLQKKPPPEIGDVRVCRLMPPSLCMFPVSEGKQVRLVQMIGFPPVTDDTWCYQFQPLPETPN